MESVLHVWRKVELPALQRQLDIEASNIANRQDEAEESRSKLVELSKDFCNKTTEDARKHFSPLVRNFQSEVDNLTRRSNSAEAAFTKVYKILAEIPDPLPLLELSNQWKAKAQLVNDAELEVHNLRQTLSSYNQEFAEIRNQDVTIRELREKVKSYEDLIDNEIQHRLSEQVRIVQANYEDRQEKLRETEALLQLKNDEVEKRSDRLQQALTSAQNELFELRAKTDQSQAIGTDQLEMMDRDAERAEDRAQNAEREVLILRRQLEQKIDAGNSLNEQAQSTYRQQIVQLEAQFSSKEKQIDQLIEENRTLNSRLVECSREFAIEMDRLKAELVEKTQLVDHLQTTVNMQTDYGEVKRELSVMKSIEFGEEEQTEDEKPKSLEVLLLEKNKALQAETTCLKLAINDLEGPPSAGSLQTMVDTIGRLVGREMALEYSDPIIDGQLNRQLKRQRRRELDVEQGQLVTKVGQIKVEETHHLPPADSLPWDPGDLSLSVSPQIAELQSLIRENARQFGNRPLNTIEIARHCRRLMVAYNLGQRLFAKLILNQSQGSLSELLSKPRHWSQLTEKGREAFRRIAAWMADTRTVQLLCEMSPRRIAVLSIEHPKPEMLFESDPLAFPPNNTPLTSFDRNSDYRRQRRKYLSHNCDKSRPSTVLTRVFEGRQEGDKLMGRVGHRTSSRWRHDDIPKEKILDIFNKELAKLRKDSTLSTMVGNRSTGNCSKSLILSSRSCSSSDSIPAISAIETDPSSSSTSSSSTYRPISLLSLKTAISPINQDQFELFAQLDTEETVRHIRDYLAFHSISQRQFGELVLGLSQGSVSDLLARPKPWDMLTQKGREPFIRMRLFLQGKKWTIREQNSHSFLPTTPSQSTSPTNDRLATVNGHELREFDDDLTNYDTGPDWTKDEEARKAAENGIVVVEPQAVELDTEQLTFKDVAFGTDPGTNSDLLSRLKFRPSLSCRDKEPCLKVLCDPFRVDQLVVRPQSSSSCSSSSGHQSQNHPKRPLPNDDASVLPKKCTRTVISDHQKAALKFVFGFEPHPLRKTVDFLSSELLLTNRTVTNWFHNYRTRQKTGTVRTHGRRASRSLLEEPDKRRRLLLLINGRIDIDDIGDRKSDGLLDKAVARIRQLAQARNQ